MGAENALRNYNFNVPQPDMGKIINNALAQKSEVQQQKIRQNQLNDYPEDRKALESERKFKKKTRALALNEQYTKLAKQQLMLVDTDLPPDQYKAAIHRAAKVLGTGMMEMGGFEQDEIGMMLGPMLEIYAENPEALKAAQQEAAYTPADNVVKGGQVINKKTGKAKNIEGYDPAAEDKKLTSDQHWDKHNKLTQDLAKYSKSEEMTAADFDSMSESAQQIITWAGGGPGKKLDPAVKARIVSEIEKKIAYHAENIPEMANRKDPKDPMGIR